MAVNKYYRDDPKRFVDHLCKMGLDQPLGLQIAGEQKPVIRKPGDKWWDGTTLTMMSYGMRCASLRSNADFLHAVANGGKMVSPLLVKELRQYGQTLRTFGARTMVSSIASRETLEEVREAMRGASRKERRAGCGAGIIRSGERPARPRSPTPAAAKAATTSAR